MDSGTAALLGAAIGAGASVLTTMVGAVMAHLRWRRDRAEARDDRLFDHRLSAHSDFFAALLAASDWVSESLRGEEEGSEDAQHAAVSRAHVGVRVVAQREAGAAAKVAVDAAHYLLRSRGQVFGDRPDPVDAFEEAIRTYHDALQRDIGAAEPPGRLSQVVRDGAPRVAWLRRVVRPR